MADQVEPLAAQIGDFAAARDFRRVGCALKRRLDVWQQIVRLDGNEPIAEPPEPNPAQLALALAKIDAMTGGTDVGKAWREYLLIDALEAMVVATCLAREHPLVRGSAFADVGPTGSEANEPDAHVDSPAAIPFRRAAAVVAGRVAPLGGRTGACRRPAGPHGAVRAVGL